MRRQIISDILWSIVGIFIVGSLIWGVKSFNHYPLPLKEKVGNFFEMLKLRFRIIEHNISTDFRRARPLKATIFLKETQLKSYIGSPFIYFSRQEWSDFWRLIYGYKNESTSLGQSVKVPYSKEEIEDILCDRYDIFCRFQANHWNLFWQLILGR